MGWVDTVKYAAIGVVAAAVLYYFVLRRCYIDTAPRNLQVYTALRSPTVRETRTALDRRLALAVREAGHGARACVVCGFANTTRAAVLSCVLCGAALPAVSTWRSRWLFRKNSALQETTESSRQRRARRRQEWLRHVESPNTAVVWHYNGRPLDATAKEGFPFYTLQANREQPQVSPAPSPVEKSPARRGIDEVEAVDEVTGIADTTGIQDATLSMITAARRLENMVQATTMCVVDVRESDAAQMAFTRVAIPAAAVQIAQQDFPAKLVHFMTSVAHLLSEPSNSGTPPVIRFFIQRDQLWSDSVDAMATLPANQVRLPIRVAFIGEPGIDAGALYREWIGSINKALVTPQAGIFTCVDSHEQTFYLNPHSRELLGEAHLAHFLVAGRLIGRALLDGNVTGFQLAPPLLKIMLGLPVGFDDLEYFDAEIYKSLQWLLTNDRVDALGLDFTVVEKLPDGTLKVVELVPGGSEVDVTDVNKLEYVDRKLKYVLFESVQSQLFAFLVGLYEVVPVDLLVAFDAEELGLLLSGSDEIDVDDWEANTIAFLDDGRGARETSLSGLPCYDNFWRVVREMSSDERRRLLHFATGSTRPPPGGFSSLTSYDGRLALFTLRGVPEESTCGSLRSHACFNRVDLPTFWTLRKMRAAVHAAISVHEDGFTIA